MNESVYIVKSGDSLSKIARAHGTTALSIARLNNITHIDVIRVGQHLRIPSRSANTSRTTILATPSVAPAGHDSDDEEESSSLWIRFVDAFQQPIQQFKASVQAGTKLVEHLTDASGYLPRIEIPTGSTVIVAVEKIVGGKKKVAELVATETFQHVLLTSPKATVASSQQVHEGPKRATSPPSPQSPGTVETTRSSNGNPVEQVMLECPNTDNLCLKANFKYRDIVLAAAKRSGYQPQAIAAIMNAEAATIVTTELVPVIGKDGEPVIDKKTGKPKIKKLTKNTGEWNEKSASPLSSARGMTQFLDGSWIDQAVTDGTYLNAEAKSEGWLTTTTVQNGKTSKTIPAFKKSDGELVTATAKRSLARVLRIL
jgi:murein DD-endopeptidase MepM/ murein hydrolase activator NlpD